MIPGMQIRVLCYSAAIRCVLCWIVAWLPLLAPLQAKYRARPYVPNSIGSYPARLTSEGITIAVEPLLTDALAAKVFDKDDIVARGILPLAVIISNDNSFAVDVDASSIELIVKDNRVLPVGPDVAIQRIFQWKLPPQEVRVPSPVPFPTVVIYKSNADAFDDFARKHLGLKKVEPKSLAAGFIYLPVTSAADVRRNLAEARIYIPKLYRDDTGGRMMFIEIDLKPALEASPEK